MRSAIATVLVCLASALHAQAALPPGYWTEAQSAEILAKTEVIRIGPSLDALTDAERTPSRTCLRSAPSCSSCTSVRVTPRPLPRSKN